MKIPPSSPFVPVPEPLKTSKRSIVSVPSPLSSNKQFQARRESPKELPKLKTEILSKHLKNKDLTKEVLDLSFECFGDYLKGSVRNQVYFYDHLKTILSNGPLAETFAKFLIQCINAKDERWEQIRNPSKNIDETYFNAARKERDIFTQFAFDPDLTKFCNDILDMSWGMHSLLFSEGSQLPFNDLSNDEKILAGSGYKSSGNGFLWEKREVIDEAVYRIGVAIPGSKVYETTITLDFKPFLSPISTKEDLKELYQLFDALAKSALPKRIKILEDVRNKHGDRSVFAFLNNRDFSALMKYMTYLFGTKERLGFIERQITACKLGVTKRVEDATRSYLDPKIQESLGLIFNHNPNIANDSKQVEKLVFMLRSLALEKLSPHIFLGLHQMIVEMEEISKNEITDPKLFQELYEILSNPKTKITLLKFIQVLSSDVSSDDELYKEKEGEIQALLSKNPALKDFVTSL